MYTAAARVRRAPGAYTVSLVRTLHLRRAASTAPRRSCALTWRPASPAAPRESPTPVVFFSSPWYAAATWERHGRLPAALRAAGHEVGFLDLPGYGGAQGWLAGATIDDVVEDVHATLAAAGCAPVLAVAASSTAQLLQKYLESYALAGLVALAPLPPAPAATLARWQAGGKIGAAAANQPLTARRLASGLRRWASAAAGEEPSALRGLLGAGADEAAAAAWAAATEVPCSITEEGPDAPRLCGYDAAGALLAALGEQPVNLEPQPVPMLAFRGAHDTLTTQEEFEEVLYYHSLGSDSCVLPGAGHDLLLSPDESAAATLEAGVLRFAAKWF